MIYLNLPINFILPVMVTIWALEVMEILQNLLVNLYSSFRIPLLKFAGFFVF